MPETPVSSPTAGDVPILLKGAWVANYLLSARFGPRRHLLLGGRDGVSSTDAAGWKSFFSSSVANSSPDSVYNEIVQRDGRKLTGEQIAKLRACTLELCFFIGPGRPAPIVYPLEVPFLRSMGSVQAVRQQLLEERRDYVTSEMSTDSLNSPREYYVTKLWDRIEQTVVQFNATRQTIENEIAAF